MKKRLRNRIIINAHFCRGGGGGSSSVPQGFLMEPLFFSVFLLITEVLLGTHLETFLKHSVSESGKKKSFKNAMKFMQLLSNVHTQ